MWMRTNLMSNKVAELPPPKKMEVDPSPFLINTHVLSTLFLLTTMITIVMRTRF